MMYFKACPKCHGDLYLNKDVYGLYVECFQCGFMKDIIRENAVLNEVLAQTADQRKTA